MKAWGKKYREMARDEDKVLIKLALNLNEVPGGGGPKSRAAMRLGVAEYVGVIDPDKAALIGDIVMLGKNPGAAIKRMSSWVRWAHATLRRFGLDDEAQAVRPMIEAGDFEPDERGAQPNPSIAAAIQENEKATKDALAADIEHVREFVSSSMHAEDTLVHEKAGDALCALERIQAAL